MIEGKRHKAIGKSKRGKGKKKGQPNYYVLLQQSETPLYIFFYDSMC